MNFDKLWKGKKITALIFSIVVVILTFVLNQRLSLDLNPNVLLSVLGLSAIYVLRQGSLDSKKTDENVFKPFWTSRKWIASMIGVAIPLIIGIVNKRYGTSFSPEMVLSLVGLDAVYILRQGALDAKNPSVH